MRQPNYRRGRGRGNARRVGGGRNQTVDSSGPNIKVRGTAAQVLEKYLALARDASTSGDRIMAENYFQHAEHYYRVLNANGAGSERDSGDRGGNGKDPDPIESAQGRKKDDDASASDAQAQAKERKQTRRATTAEPSEVSETAEEENAADDELAPVGSRT